MKVIWKEGLDLGLERSALSAPSLAQGEGASFETGLRIIAEYQGK